MCCHVGGQLGLSLGRCPRRKGGLPVQKRAKEAEVKRRDYEYMGRIVVRVRRWRDGGMGGAMEGQLGEGGPVISGPVDLQRARGGPESRDAQRAGAPLAPFD